MKIYCCGCEREVEATLTTGDIIYPHRPDLSHLPFWRCGTCKNYVGCHHKTADRTRPLGCIPTREIMELRKQIHAVLDPWWRARNISRGKAYARISSAIGKPYHTGEISSVVEGKRILSIVLEMTQKCN